MAGWLWWKKGPNYEQELPRLASEIQKYRTKLISVTARHRRWRALSILLQLGAYLFILSYYFLVVTKPYLNAWQLGHVFSGPLVIYLLHTTLSRGLLWREARIKSSLQRLIVRRQQLVDAYKKQINFDLIQRLIDDPPSDPNPIKGTGDSKSTAKSPHLQQHQPSAAPAPNKTKTSGVAAPGNPPPQISASHNGPSKPRAVENNSAANPLPALPVYHTSWVDRVMDLVLGENEQGPNNRYALICSKCRVHNGLAPYGKSADEVGYFCPVCHTFNGSEQAHDALPNDSISNDKAAVGNSGASVANEGAERAGSAFNSSTGEPAITSVEPVASISDGNSDGNLGDIIPETASSAGGGSAGHLAGNSASDKSTTKEEETAGRKPAAGKPAVHNPAVDSASSAVAQKDQVLRKRGV